MEQPLDLTAHMESGKVCKLKMSLYGLKKSPRAWFRSFNLVKTFGLCRRGSDHCVSYWHHQGRRILLVKAFGLC